ncbi:L-rhamnose isomerase/sugar isomerase [Kribbella aluminosa]|uniref:L-rhamnose isomerase/sugar isomerase n=1 Tax=Kribbella aluminosa TaxID=416017 RepID=A0ABS4UJB5_9ACTN|nr:L-rhamnose isomerase [Kribbella aluminosa]MBP2351624.1 L-rhamnose isomerase/sugar isomerase [Kribbella aluminosa]
MTASPNELVERIAGFTIETQSWGYVSTGTRFKVFNTPGTPRTVHEKVDDAALVHRLTGVTPTVALHIPWDRTDYAELRRYAEEQGVRIGSISPNIFQDDDYHHGSFTNPDPAIRAKAVATSVECVGIMRTTGSKQLSMWVADGTNYPGQGDFRRRRAWLQDSLQQVYDALDPDMSMILEYKLFEPAFYHTDISDWGQSLLLCQELGDRANVLVDLGHHALGVNIEHIVATLLGQRRLGGFDLNGKRYADDDLMVGSTNPYELFLIMAEITHALADPDPGIAAGAADVLFKIDQCAMVEEKLPAMLRSIEACQIAYAKSLLIDRDELRKAQDTGDVVGANTLVDSAFQTDVRPFLWQARELLGGPADPLRAYLDSGLPERLAAERIGAPAGW